MERDVNSKREELKLALTHYKTVTIKLINCLEREEFESIELLFNERQKLIEVMDKMDYTTEEFKNISKELEILNSEEILNKALDTNRTKARIELEKMNNIKNAKSSYNKGVKADSIFFNKRI